MLIINAIKSGDYKKNAFECQGEIDDSVLREPMSLSTTYGSGFYNAKQQAKEESMDEKEPKKDQSMETIFRSSLKGFFTG